MNSPQADGNHFDSEYAAKILKFVIIPSILIISIPNDGLENKTLGGLQMLAILVIWMSLIVLFFLILDYLLPSESFVIKLLKLGLLLVFGYFGALGALILSFILYCTDLCFA